MNICKEVIWAQQKKLEQFVRIKNDYNEVHKDIWLGEQGGHLEAAIQTPSHARVFFFLRNCNDVIGSSM